jgi:hypothetical protein
MSETKTFFKGEEATLTAQIRFRAPKAVWVVLSFGDGFAEPAIKHAFAYNDSPYDYDLEANECFLVYHLDESATPLTRLLEADAGDGGA